MSGNFENIEIRRAANGFVVVVSTEDDTKEYIFDSSRKCVKFVREYVDVKNPI